MKNVKQVIARMLMLNEIIYYKVLSWVYLLSLSRIFIIFTDYQCVLDIMVTNRFIGCHDNSNVLKCDFYYKAKLNIWISNLIL